jgi:hypothetical protein
MDYSEHFFLVTKSLSYLKLTVLLELKFISLILAIVVLNIVYFENAKEHSVLNIFRLIERLSKVNIQYFCFFSVCNIALSS